MSKRVVNGWVGSVAGPVKVIEGGWPLQKWLLLGKLLTDSGILKCLKKTSPSSAFLLLAN